MKIMCLGDSITDDCAINGAWRAYLQPMLASNGYSFTFVGRVHSTPGGTFTQTNHEGYCGAVVASPGLNNPGHGYSTANNYLSLVVRDALTNVTPDLILILIGANDLGNGRNPRLVATNHITNLLAILFSNAPNANVILAKPTSLQSATGGYGAYATNVPIYGGALQAVVNQRRSLGQNVFLADMFSAVDYGSMFGSDHIHPNASGFQAIAGEWMTRIKNITTRTNWVMATLISGGAIWKYSDTGQDFGADWSQPGYDDSGWSSGPARLGYGDNVAVTTINYGSNPNARYPTTYFRRQFVVPPNAVITNLHFRLARQEGAVVWLNGTELFRVNMPAGDITYSTLASSLFTNIYQPYIFYPTDVVVPAVPAGTNLIAVEVHKFSRLLGTFGFDMEMMGSGSLVSQPVTATALADQTNNVGGTVTFTTTATGPEPLRYSWWHDDVSLPAQTNASLTLNSIGYGDAGIYTVIVGGATGAVVTNSARLTVVPRPVLIAIPLAGPNGLALNWTGYVGGFALEMATDLSETNWFPVIPLVEGNGQVLLSGTNSSVFFRLRK